MKTVYRRRWYGNKSSVEGGKAYWWTGIVSVCLFCILFGSLSFFARPSAFGQSYPASAQAFVLFPICAFNGRTVLPPWRNAFLTVKAGWKSAVNCMEALPSPADGPVSVTGRAVGEHRSCRWHIRLQSAVGTGAACREGSVVPPWLTWPVGRRRGSPSSQVMSD